MQITSLHTVFREPEYPILLDLDGYPIAGRSDSDLLQKLATREIATGSEASELQYPAVDCTGEEWLLCIDPGNRPDEAMLMPSINRRPWTKRKIIELYNQRKNKRRGETPYSMKSLSSKRLDTIIAQLAERLEQPYV